MPLPMNKFEIGSEHMVVVGDCSARVKIGAKTYSDIKDTWVYYISGNGNCGRWSEWVNELFLTEHVVATS